MRQRDEVDDLRQQREVESLACECRAIDVRWTCLGDLLEAQAVGDNYKEDV